MSAALAGHHGIARRFVDRAAARASDPRVSLPAAAQTFMSTAVVPLASGAWDEVAQRMTRTLDVCERGALHHTAALVMPLGAIARYHVGRMTTRRQ
jgi:hypothetical protein